VILIKNGDKMSKNNPKLSVQEACETTIYVWKRANQLSKCLLVSAQADANYKFERAYPSIKKQPRLILLPGNEVVVEGGGLNHSQGCKPMP